MTEEDIMKNICRTMIGVLLFIVVAFNSMVYAAPIPVTTKQEELRGLWVATVLNIDYPSKPTTDASVLKNEAITILDHAKYMGLNAVFLQVRPASDALYPSTYFPWSKYLTGGQAVPPTDEFDPLAFWVDEAHARGIQLHAWINPYRITKKTAKEPKHDFASLSPHHPAILHPEWVVMHSDGNLYFNPGIPEVRSLVIDSCLEIIKNYDIDGIHFDDYFYPGKDFNDKNAYEKFGESYRSIDDWRRENVNLLISDLSKAIKSTSSNVRFGISPFGIWANKATNSLGSDTKGMQSYYDQYADTRKWVKEGMIDYIAPQLYWNIGFTIADYSKLLHWWVQTTKGTGVDLYIGQAAYRVGNTDSTSPWYGISEIEKQLRLNQKFPEVKGSIYFNYKSLQNMPALSAVIKALYEQKDGSKTNTKLSISRPSKNIKTTYTHYYMNGASDPDMPLWVNGKILENRSSQGFFGILLPLVKGDNIITISQGGSYETRIIHREISSSPPPKMNTAEIPAASVFPQTQQLWTSGEKITLSCQAPLGSKVTVTLAGKTYTMTSSYPPPKDSGLYRGTFTYVYTLPAYTGTPRNIDLGTPVYTMNYKGMVKKRKATGKIGVIMKDSPYYAEVNKPVAYTYSSSTAASGAIFELYKGMQDYITGMTGHHIRLSNGQWMNKGDVKIFSSKSPLKATIKKADYRIGPKWDQLKFTLSAPVASTISFNGSVLELSILSTSSGLVPTLPQNSLLSSANFSVKDNKVLYALMLKDSQPIDGYYIEKTSDGIILNIKRPVKVNSGNTPLQGITIMLDPGHGDSDSGAQGPLGLRYAEKAINLDFGLKLQEELKNLGATVLMTRTTDIELSLEARLAASRKAKPDLFISLHANSMNDNVDISTIDGFSMYYRDKHAKFIAQTILNTTLDTLNRKNKGIHNKNFYVIRGTWTPSVLIESGFVPNPVEFEWLINEDEQAKLAKTIAEGIVKSLTR